MTVSELIELLGEFPKDYTVTFDNIGIDYDSIDVHDEWKEVDFHV